MASSRFTVLGQGIVEKTSCMISYGVSDPTEFLGNGMIKGRRDKEQARYTMGLGCSSVEGLVIHSIFWQSHRHEDYVNRTVPGSGVFHGGVYASPG